MSTILSPTPPAALPLGDAAPRPTLNPGDRLTRAEFERRYLLRPDIKKAELIEGVVYIMPSPVSAEFHGEPHADVLAWLGVYKADTPGVRTGDNSTVRLDLDNEPQPDAHLRIHESCGGQSHRDADKYITGAPELIVEVAASSASYDLHAKLNAYRRNAVQEYVVLLTEEPAVKWFRLREGRFVELPGDDDGIIRSEVFPGLWLDTRAMLAGDLTRVLALLQRGIAAPEHAAFVEKLRSARTPQSQPTAPTERKEPCPPPL